MRVSWSPESVEARLFELEARYLVRQREAARLKRGSERWTNQSLMCLLPREFKKYRAEIMRDLDMPGAPPPTPEPRSIGDVLVMDDVTYAEHRDRVRLVVSGAL